MKLNQLLEGLDCRVLQGDSDREISGVCYDSRKVRPGDLFVCLAGARSDGHAFAAQAVAAGAAALAVEHPVEGLPQGVSVVQFPDTRLALALLSAAWFGHPARKLPVIGITGTKGKTSTACMVAAILRRAGHKVALIGTIGTWIGEDFTPTDNTTPESYLVQQTLAQAVAEGCDWAVMEVSSQAMKLSRVAGIPFACGVFTNLSPDHIGPGEHENFEEYLACKAALFRQCSFGIFNGEDPYVGQMMAQAACESEQFGACPGSHWRAEEVRRVRQGGRLEVAFHLSGILEGEVTVGLPGDFSVHNALAALAVGHRCGVDFSTMAAALAEVTVKGRLEPVPVPGEYALYLDYAHNAFSLEALLTTLRAYEPGRLICLFGCGGNRDPHRRTEMGRASGRLADISVVTSDNPRFENPLDIMEPIIRAVLEEKGVALAIADRRQAMDFCLSFAQAGDIVVFAGKGHEDYVEIEGKKYPFDERVVIRELLEKRAKNGQK